jgi:hypothetical protein
MKRGAMHGEERRAGGKEGGKAGGKEERRAAHNGDIRLDRENHKVFQHTCPHALLHHLHRLLFIPP